MPSTIPRLIPWTQLIRYGVPDEWCVVRRPLTSGVDSEANAITYQPGDLLPKEVIQSRVRLRQLYEQRLIVPVVSADEKVEGMKQPGRQTPQPPNEPVDQIDQVDQVASDLPFDPGSIVIPEEQEPDEPEMVSAGPSTLTSSDPPRPKFPSAASAAARRKS